jgi:hypothetical protein
LYIQSSSQLDSLVWLSHPVAEFLNGKFVWANWDVEELMAMAEEIASGTLLTANIDGWPFPTPADS